MNVFNAVLIFLILILIIICNLIYFNSKVLKKYFGGVRKRTWFLLILIFLSGLLLRMFLIPHMHNLYYDEDGYLDIAKHISKEGNNCLCLYNTNGACNFCGYSLKSVGFSFLLAVFFKIFGISHNVAFNVVVVFGSLTIFVMFLFLYALFEKEGLALLGALILALYPLHLRWSGSVSAEIISLFFILLTFLFLILYFRIGKLTVLLTSVLLLCFTMAVKEENILLGLFFLVPFITERKYRKIFLILSLFFVCLLLPYLLGNFIFHTESGIENYAARYTFWKQGKILDFSFFKDTILQNLFFFINKDYTFLIVILFSFLGAIFMFKENKKLGLMFTFWPLLVLSLFSSYLGIPLVFDEVRHYIPMLLSVVTFSSYGMFYLYDNHFFRRIKFFDILIVIVLVSIVFYIPYLTSQKSPVLTAQRDHDFIIQSLDKVPEECLIVTQESYLFDFFDRSATSIYLEGLPLDEDCLFYYKGELCYSVELIETCKRFEEKTKMENYLTNGRHAFYKINSINLT